MAAKVVRRPSHLLSRLLDAHTQRGFATSIGDGLLEYEETTCESSDRTNEATGLVVHGLLGSGRNWRSFSRALAKDLAQATGRPWRFWLVDQRCHGNSLFVRGLKPPSTVAASAADVGKLIDARLQEVRIDAILGHSLGGKVVMDLLAQRKSCPPSNQVWVLDSVVGAARPGSGEPSDVKRVLEEVEKIEMPVQSRHTFENKQELLHLTTNSQWRLAKQRQRHILKRDWLYQHLESRGFSQGFRLWMGSNLQIRDGQYHWAFHVKCAQQLYESYQESEYWEVAREPPAGVTLNIVRAAKSDRWTDKQWSLLREAAAASEGRLKLHTLPKAGHWLHADNPEGLRRLLATHVAAAESR